MTPIDYIRNFVLLRLRIITLIDQSRKHSMAKKRKIVSNYLNKSILYNLNEKYNLYSIESLESQYFGWEILMHPLYLYLLALLPMIIGKLPTLHVSKNRLIQFLSKSRKSFNDFTSTYIHNLSLH